MNDEKFLDAAETLLSIIPEKYPFTAQLGRAREFAQKPQNLTEMEKKFVVVTAKRVEDFDKQEQEKEMKQKENFFAMQRTAEENNRRKQNDYEGAYGNPFIRQFLGV